MMPPLSRVGQTEWVGRVRCRQREQVLPAIFLGSGMGPSILPINHSGRAKRNHQKHSSLPDLGFEIRVCHADSLHRGQVLGATRQSRCRSSAIGLRNSHDKSFSLALTVGYRVFGLRQLAFHGDFSPVTRKHTKNFDYVEVIGGAVDKMQRHFEPMRRQIDAWQGYEAARHQGQGVIYEAFIDSAWTCPSTSPAGHQNYFEPTLDDFRPARCGACPTPSRRPWHPRPCPQMQYTAKLAPFLAAVQ